MKKIISIFGVVLFAFALTLSSCGDTNNDSKKEKVECKADCAKSCCLGCKATDGEKKCIKLEDGTMPCCVEKECAADCDKECCVEKECADDCAKACCLGCKATEGEADCELLATKDHSCCTPEEAPHDETVPHTH